MRGTNLKFPQHSPSNKKEILEQRGVLTLEEVHKLAAKVKGKMAITTEGKASCHSDAVDSETAKALQES